MCSVILTALPRLQSRRTSCTQRFCHTPPRTGAGVALRGNPECTGNAGSGHHRLSPQISGNTRRELVGIRAPPYRRKSDNCVLPRRKGSDPYVLQFARQSSTAARAFLQDPLCVHRRDSRTERRQTESGLTANLQVQSRQIFCSVVTQDNFQALISGRSHLNSKIARSRRRQ